MDYAEKDYIINTVFRTNILPVISECNTSCTFCSNKYNPDSMEVYKMHKMSIKDFEEIIGFLSPDKKIVVGEAATRIIEGEPLLYEDFPKLLELLRKRFKHTSIQITTNGILLNEKLVEKMIDLGNIELNISINSIDPLKRKKLLGLKKEDEISEKITLIKGKLKYSASCVYDPEILSLDDVEELVAFLDINMADNIRIFLPGFTKEKKSEIEFFDIHKKVNEFANKLRVKYQIPIMIEPSVLTNLEGRIDGVIPNSPAFLAGIRYGDVILKVNGQIVESRVDAFQKSYKSSDPVIKINRESQESDIKIYKNSNSSPGFIVAYDIDPDTSKKIIRVIRKYSPNKVLILTSELGYEIIKRLMDIADSTFSCDIQKVSNNLFGGTIKCAGLLVIEDINLAIEDYLKKNDLPDLILLPPLMFDFKGRDLMGHRMKEVEERYGIPVDTI